jgi:hypothetical protein
MEGPWFSQERHRLQLQENVQRFGRDPEFEVELFPVALQPGAFSHLVARSQTSDTSSESH